MLEMLPSSDAEDKRLTMAMMSGFASISNNEISIFINDERRIITLMHKSSTNSWNSKKIYQKKEKEGEGKVILPKKEGTHICFK